jgi:hypothetical protein
VQVFEFGEETDGTGVPRPYLTLELVPGSSLAQKLDGRPQPPTQAAAWLEPLAIAIHCAITFNNPRYESNYPSDTSERVRHAAITHIRDMKNAKQALKQLLLVSRTDSETNRLEAIESLLSIYDENNDKAISKVLEGMRFDKSESVRKAVEQAVDKLKKK